MKAPHDKLRADYLEIMKDLQEHTLLARNYAMQPGNTWLARAELSKASSLINDAELLLEEIKQSDMIA